MSLRAFALTVLAAPAVVAGAAQGLRMLDGHVGIWLEETAHMDLRNSLVRNNDSTGIGRISVTPDVRQPSS